MIRAGGPSGASSGVLGGGKVVVVVEVVVVGATVVEVVVVAGAKVVAILGAGSVVEGRDCGVVSEHAARAAVIATTRRVARKYGFTVGSEYR
ncbi:hypothetical protein HQ535_11115 [bacterium]|nr:hypothetical protein [bacterium]